MFIEGATQPENEVERTGKIEILKVERPENVIDAKDSIEIMALEKEDLSCQLIIMHYILKE